MNRTRPSPGCSRRGYAIGHFGKNHLGDKDELLPTNHGFEELCGNLYHLNALDRFGPTKSTIVSYSTDSGRHRTTWPDTASTPYRGERNTTWEGAQLQPRPGS